MITRQTEKKSHSFIDLTTYTWNRNCHWTQTNTCVTRLALSRAYTSAMDQQSSFNSINPDPRSVKTYLSLLDLYIYLDPHQIGLTWRYQTPKYNRSLFIYSLRNYYIKKFPLSRSASNGNGVSIELRPVFHQSVLDIRSVVIVSFSFGTLESTWSF